MWEVLFAKADMCDSDLWHPEQSPKEMWLPNLNTRNRAVTVTQIRKRICGM
ncbi:hypothetical protein Poly51_04910 [Rubripirellula tenax]|uniref:Uncharacterized protein n=1 Tax=Rubripirellula tenax TaxID=2528015 RepID=A0A5C6FEI0_9BACT|nr:hypothetical protein Poly51_04910 [Rubripirellula tenax]